MQITESILQQVRHKVGDKLSVASSSLSLVGAVDGPLDLGLSTIGRVDVVEELHQQHGLRLEAGLVVVVGYNKEYILQNGDEESLEEGVGCLDISLLGDVVDQLQGHVKTSRLDISVVMLESPRARVDNKLELVVVELEQSREAVKVDGSEEVEELDSVLGEL